MAAVNLKPNPLERLNAEVRGVEPEGAEQIFLTPYLALACGLLYMMASDGKLVAQESGQLQAVLGRDKAVLGYALRYVHAVPVEQFLAMASELLSVKDKWCILTNVNDALLADGHADPAELALFAEMRTAFGVQEAQFDPYFKILSLKNDKSVLGPYVAVRNEHQALTPHFALAISLLYMLIADGSIRVQEVGQLEVVIGEFDGLQNAALKYVRKVKFKQFLEQVSALLKPDQKIYILTNVCDLMLSDGEVTHLEDKLFLSMLTAFGFTEKTFTPYLQVLEAKNLKPFDTSPFKNRVSHERLTGGEDASGITFKNELTDVNSTIANSHEAVASQGVWVGAEGDPEMSQFVSRAMENNIQSVSDEFENQSNAVKIELNVTDSLNIQTLDESEAANNRQRIDAAGASDNAQKIDVSAHDVNRQSIESADGITNRQSINSHGADVNLQTVDGDVHEVDRESMSPELRLQNIHEVAQEVKHRLDRFEVAHSRFLQIGRAQKLTDAFVLFEDVPSSLNRQAVDASSDRMALDLSLTSDGTETTSDVMLVTQEPEALEEAEKYEVCEDVVAHVVVSQEATTSPAAPSSSSNADAFTVLADRAGQVKKMLLSRAWGLYRGRGFACVQLVVATFAIVFAAPIETRSMLRRSVAGPLITAPSESRDVEPSSVQGDLNPR